MAKEVDLNRAPRLPWIVIGLVCLPIVAFPLVGSFKDEPSNEPTTSDQTLAIEKAAAEAAAVEAAAATTLEASPSTLIEHPSTTPQPTGSATDTDIDRLTTYAVVLGRATACGVDTSYAVSRVGAWMDRIMPPGSSDQRIYLPIFMAGVEQNARAQSQGQSPDSCESVRASFARFTWP